MYNTLVMWPIVSAIWAAIGFLGGDSITMLSPVNSAQEAFIQDYVAKKEVLSSFKPTELRSWASSDIDALNKILKKEGYTIQLDPATSPTDFGVVSILDIALQWLQKGEVTTITGKDGKEYPAVQMKLNEACDLFFPSLHRYPVISIKTETGDVVSMTMVNEQYDAAALIDLIDNIKTGPIAKPLLYDQVIFPMINYNKEVSLDWLKGLHVGTYYISQALQQTKFKMNECGARAQSAVAIVLKELSCVTPKSHVIDQPFVLWIDRPGVQEPIFAAYLSYDDWGNPGTL